MKTQILTLTVTLLSLLATSAGVKADTFYYNFGTGTSGAVGANPAVTTTTSDPSTPGGVTAGNFTIGDSNGTVSSPINITSPSNSTGNMYTTAATSTYTSGVASSGSDNLGNAVFTGALNLATSSYYDVVLTPTQGDTLTFSGLSFGERSTSTGPQAFSIEVSSNSDLTFTDVMDGTFTNTSVYAAKGGIFTTGYVDATSTPLDVRIYTYGGTGTGSAGTENSRIDDVSITATATVPAASVTEPSSYTLLFVGLGMMALFARVRFLNKV